MIYVILYTHIENIKNLLNGPAGLFTFETCIVVYPLKNFKNLLNGPAGRYKKIWPPTWLQTADELA